MNRRLLSLILATALVAASAIVSTAPALGGGGARSEHDRILAYWTPARMKAAIPRDFVKTASGRFQPARKPGGGSGNVTGASWTKVGAILPASGKVYFVMGGGAYICSGSVVNDARSDSSIVLTAGHCAIDETTGFFATDWLFIPEFDSSPTYTCSNTKWGCWTASALVVDSGFATAGAFNTQATVHDWAFAVVGSGGKGDTQLDATVGSFPIAFDAVAQKMYAFGYPAAGKYNGSDLVYCAGTVFSDAYNANKTWGMNCDMTGGASGGPWLKSFSEMTASGTLDSLNSYKYTGRSTDMYGPKFNSNTQTTYAYANDTSTTANKIVSVSP